MARRAATDLQDGFKQAKEHERHFQAMQSFHEFEQSITILGTVVTVNSIARRLVKEHSPLAQGTG
jgi:hypothetical protein